MRRKPLPVVPQVVCPAAVPIAGCTPNDAGVICRVMEQDRDREKGVGMTPGAHAMSRDGSDGVLLTAKSDPSTIERMCCAQSDPPVLDHFDKGGGRDSYTYCPVWQAEKDRIAEGREMLAETPRRESVGVDERGRELFAEDVRTQAAAVADPWSTARRDLDVLAPGV